MTPLKLLVVAGARPNFMKVAPLLHAAADHNRRLLDGARPVQCSLVHTGQHYDASMSGVFFRELGIPEPDHNLEVGSGSHAAQTAQIMLRFEPVLEKERPDWVVVVGDVNSTVACTLVAAKMGIRIAHVEAGLRSFDRTMPEEINRLVTDAISDLLLTPSEDGNENLRREGIPDSKIRLVGNIMIDSLVANLPKARESRVLETLGLQGRDFAYVTLHRPANVDDPATLETIITALAKVSASVPIIFPIHPRTRQRLGTFGLAETAAKALRLVDPLGYHDSLHLTENARLVLTDSGGLQEEATFFRTPCLTLRPNTERPVTVSVGSNRLVTPAQLETEVRSVLAGERRRGKVPDFWEGRAADRILAALLAG